MIVFIILFYIAYVNPKNAKNESSRTFLFKNHIITSNFNANKVHFLKEYDAYSLIYYLVEGSKRGRIVSAAPLPAGALIATDMKNPSI